MELSAIELNYLIGELATTLVSYYVSNIQYVDEGTVLLRLHHSVKPEQRLVISAGRGIWVTRYDLGQDRTSGLLSFLRSELIRSRLLGMQQIGSERVVYMNFETGQGFRRLIAEFFGDGNLVLTDDGNRILGLLRTLKVRHRELRRGGTYSLPPPHGLDIAKVTLRDLSPLQSSDLEVSRWMGRNISMSRRYIDEVVKRTGIDSSTKGFDLKDEHLQTLHNKIQEILTIFNTKNFEPMLIYEGERPIDASPIILKSQAGLNVKPVGSFQEAVDDVFAAEFYEKRLSTRSEPMRRKLEELDASIAEQQKIKGELQDRIGNLRLIAKKLSETFTSQEFKEDDFQKLLVDLGAKSTLTKRDRLFVTIGGYEFEIEKPSSQIGLSSQLYDIAKEMQLKSHAIESAETVLKSRRDQLSEMERSPKNRPDELRTKREKAWFERFRWFFTSEGLLSIGGRDSSSNSAVIRKHVDSSDLVFHADLHGSPFFVLKDNDSHKAQSILETAQAVVSFSSAWKDCLFSADAYWVTPEQIKKSAPSGMYLPKGSFLIEGEKNFFKKIEVESSIGVGFLEDDLVVVGGPPSSIRKNSLAFLTLKPEKVKPSGTAKQAKVELIRLLGGEIGERLKRLPLDDFIRVLPPGGGRIVSADKGEQKY